MFDLSKLSTQYHVRPMHDADADAILAFCLQNGSACRTISTIAIAANSRPGS